MPCDEYGPSQKVMNAYKFGVQETVLLVNRAFVPPKRGGFWRKRRKWRISALTSKTRALLLKGCENDENGGCPAGKGMVYQRHRFCSLINLGIANGGFQKGGFQIVERAAGSSRGNLLLQGNSYLKSTLRLLLRRRVWGRICYLKNPPSENPPFDFPNKSHFVRTEFKETISMKILPFEEFLGDCLKWLLELLMLKASWTNLGHYLAPSPCSSHVIFLYIVVSKSITDRHFCLGAATFQLQIQNHAARRSNSITETDLWEFQQKISHCRRSSLEFQFISITDSKQIEFIL